jgi:predicted TIM-barrel fold metal-dependent hydrolase
VPVKPHNVYADMGAAWGSVMTDPNQAQHYIGKLLKYLGPANVCWGTNAIFPGSPQPLIQAFRAFTITPQYQAMNGYPAITPAMKAQIFGLNAARIYRVDATTPRCKVRPGSFA